MQRKILGAMIILSLYLTGVCVHADTDTRIVLDETATLDDYMAYAALHNPGLQAAFNEWKAALERIPQARALPDPKFEYKYFIEEIETRVGPQKQSFGIMQAFPWFGTLALAGDAAGQVALAAQQRYEAARLQLLYEVKHAYYEYAYVSKALSITQDNMTLIEHLESVVRNRYQTSAAGHPAVIRAQMEWGKLDNRLRSLQAMQKPLAAQLNSALNRPANAPVPWPQIVTWTRVDVNETALLANLAETSPQIKALTYTVAQNQRNVELAGKKTRPDLMLGVSAIDTGKAVYGSPPDSGKDPVIASLSLSIPLWSSKNKAAVREAKFRQLTAQQHKKQALNQLTSQVQMALYELGDAARKIDLYNQTLLPKANESMKATETAFRAGTSNFTDLIDAQRVLLEFELARERALTDYEQSVAKIEKLTGTTLGNRK